MQKALKLLLIIIGAALIAFVTWELKPEKEISAVPADTVFVGGVDSVKIIKDALEGQIVGTYEELVSMGYIVNQIRWSDSTRWTDSLRFIDSVFTIPTLRTDDSLFYSGEQILNEDTLQISLRVRVQTLALLSPVNAIENTISIDSIKIIVPRPVPPKLLEIAREYWWFTLVGAVAWEIIR